MRPNDFQGKPKERMYRLTTYRYGSNASWSKNKKLLVDSLLNHFDESSFPCPCLTGNKKAIISVGNKVKRLLLFNVGLVKDVVLGAHKVSLMVTTAKIPPWCEAIFHNNIKKKNPHKKCEGKSSLCMNCIIAPSSIFSYSLLYSCDP